MNIIKTFFFFLLHQTNTEMKSYNQHVQDFFCSYEFLLTTMGWDNNEHKYPWFRPTICIDINKHSTDDMHMTYIVMHELYED